MNKSLPLIVVVVLLIIAAVVLLANKRTTQYPTTVENTQNVTPTQEKMAVSPTTEDKAMMDKGAVKEFTVTGANFSFDPKTITVKKGDKVKLTFKNAEGFHNLMLDEFNVATKTIPAGQSETVEFTADKTGDFQYYCSVGNHRAMGMWGTLTVTE